MLYLIKIIHLMEKKKYNKPEITNTRLDSSINLVLMSPEPDVGDPDVEGYPGDFINPLNWFK